ncbi:DUF7679 family protein [Limosilactobacillus kribbianus]|uniref:DUF7679 family protein n=1 Tax=Limosilactobacillus kribbianus TaxID=2982695 RepID=UPI002265232B|nr:hypothetical protein [Limosilactobacillus kribbianus]
MAHVFVVQVELSWGEKREYLLANDVEPGLEHRLATRKDWQEVMRGALINVPVGPYLPSERIVPPMATAKVLDVRAVAADAAPKLQRTRSQFIMAAVWQKQDSATNYNFLHHDYSPETQAQIKADVDYWVNQTSTANATKRTKQRIAEQEKEFAKEIEKKG